MITDKPGPEVIKLFPCSTQQKISYSVELSMKKGLITSGLGFVSVYSFAENDLTSMN